MKYQFNNVNPYDATEWSEASPNEQIKRLLKTYHTVTLNGTAHWRVKPRDEELIEAIHNVLVGVKATSITKGLADTIYAILEERDLV